MFWIHAIFEMQITLDLNRKKCIDKKYKLLTRFRKIFIIRSNVIFVDISKCDKIDILMYQLECTGNKGTGKYPCKILEYLFS